VLVFLELGVTKEHAGVSAIRPNDSVDVRQETGCPTQRRRGGSSSSTRFPSRGAKFNDSICELTARQSMRALSWPRRTSPTAQRSAQPALGSSPGSQGCRRGKTVLRAPWRRQQVAPRRERSASPRHRASRRAACPSRPGGNLRRHAARSGWIKRAGWCWISGQPSLAGARRGRGTRQGEPGPGNSPPASAATPSSSRTATPAAPPSPGSDQKTAPPRSPEAKAAASAGAHGPGGGPRSAVLPGDDGDGPARRGAPSRPPATRQAGCPATRMRR